MTSPPETVGLISDVHANLPALEAVLDDMPPVDALVHAGDVVGYGPWPNECVELLREHDAYSILGNHDEAVFGGRVYESGNQYAKNTLTDQNRAWLEDLPISQTLFDGYLHVAHGHPDDKLRYTTPAEFAPDLLGAEEVLVLGHTHQQAQREFDTGIVVNPGSVGQPRDRDKRAAYAVLDTTTSSVSLERVTYDIDRVSEKIGVTPISERNGLRLYDGR